MDEEEEFRDFTVEAKVSLLRRFFDSDGEDNSESSQDYQLNLVEVERNIKKDMKEFAVEQINNKSFWMWLYYNGDLPGIIFHVLEKNVEFLEHTFVVKVKARYIYPKGCTKEHLKKSVKGIFDHWFLAGYVSYILDEFNIVSAEPWGDFTLTPDIFVNSI